jgi:methionyl aminopeptidase
MGFPKSICASPNDVICHGIPDSRVLRDGDVVAFDVSVFVDGVFGDNCGTVCVGDVDAAGRRLVDATREALDAAIAVVRPGACLTEIGDACSDAADACGYGVVRQYCGHGIGTTFHAPPLVSHCRNQNKFRLQKGHVFTIEPMLTEGSSELHVAGDGWTVLTRDAQRAAQFEHTVLVTDAGYEVLTAAPPQGESYGGVLVVGQ